MFIAELTPTWPYAWHTAVTWILVGLIWVVQIVVYPQFRRIPDEVWPEFHKAHCQRVAWVVVPLVILEMGTAAAFYYHEISLTKLQWASLGMIPLIAVSTALLQGPYHMRLTGMKDAVLVEQLIATNWIRTAVWSLRALLWALGTPMTTNGTANL